MVRAHRSPVISPPARAVTAPSGRPIVPISHIRAADGFAKSDVVRSDSARRVTAARERGRDYGRFLGEEGGWQHLKALLLMGASPLTPMVDPFEDACKKIDARAKELFLR